MRNRPCLAALTLLALAAIASAALPPVPTLVPAPLERVAFLGASATHGYGTHVQIDDRRRTTDLGRTFAAAVRGDGTNVSRHSSFLFFRNPDRYGRMLLDAARKQKPTLVFGVDYLFWYGYGNVASEAARLERLETGLKRLEEFDVPVIVGDFPDMTPAVGLMLGRSQMPEKLTLQKLNVRVNAWIAEKPDERLLFPLSDLVADMQSGRTIHAAGHEWTTEDGTSLIQADQLHPTVDGLIAMVQRLVDMLHASDLGVTRDAFEVDPAAIKDRMVGLMRNGSRKAG